MIRLHETVTVQRTAADCFAYLKDFSTVEQWDPGTWRARKITPGAVAAGCEFEVVLSNRKTMRYRLESICAPEAGGAGQLVLQGSGPGFDVIDTITITDLGGGETEIDYVAEMAFSGNLARSEPLLRSYLNRMGRKAVEGIRTALTPPVEPIPLSAAQRFANRTLILAMRNFTERGYLRMPNKGLSERMDGKTVVITGPTGGLGLAAACELARLGAQLVLVGRNADKLNAALAEVCEFSGSEPGHHQIIEGDLELMSEVRRVADELLDNAPRIDVLINNAGALFNDRSETAESNERSLAILLLAPWLLTERLMPKLLESRARTINVSSSGMYLQALKLSDLQFANEPYDGTKAYARAKRGLIAITENWANEHAASGATFNSMHPGWAATPGVASALPEFNKKLEGKLRDSRMGADTICWLASSATAQTQNGKFWFDRQSQPTAVLPKTAVSNEKRQQLINALAQLTEQQ